MINQSLVSIVMPTYNRAFSVLRAISSVQNQTYEKWELIIVDDNSSDDTENILKENLQDNRILYYKLDRNVGASEARNIGMNLTKGEFITFLDSDDEYFPEKIEKQINLFLTSKIPDIGVVSCGAIDYLNEKEYNRRIPVKQKNVYKSLLSKKKRIGAGTPFLMVKAQIFRHDKIHFDSSLYAMEDWDFLVRIVKFYGFDFVPEYLVKVNHHRNERLYTSKNATVALEIQYEKYIKWLKEDPEVHINFVKQAGSLIAYHHSVERAILFLSKSLKNSSSRKEKFILLFEKVLISQLRFKFLQKMYLKYLNR